MFRQILVPVDSSPFAEQALPHAITLAKAARARVHLVMVHEMQPLGERIVTLGSDLVEAHSREVEEDYLAMLAQRLAGNLGEEPEVRLLSGAVAAALTRYASRKGIDLIVMSTHGRGGLNRAWLGSVADTLARRARVPILLTRPSEHTEWPTVASIARVLVAVDGSERGEVAARHAGSLCAATGARCTVVRVVIPPGRIIAGPLPDTTARVRETTGSATQEAEGYLADLPGRFSLPASTRTEVVTANNVADAILRTAESDRSDVVAIGTRGHGGATRLILGSVADKVIRGSPVPVLVCPSPGVG
jgi:nucleotide-binding universal stress UspA family protein